MRFITYVDEEGSPWPPRQFAPGDAVVIDVDAAIRLDDAAAEALSLVGDRIRGLYFFGDEGPIYSPVSLRDVSRRPPELMPFPAAVPDATGELLWTEGARDRVTLDDLQRAKTGGFFNGDPGGIFLERPMYGEAPPGWLDLLSWLSDVGGTLALAGMLIDIVRNRWERWKSRGAVTPFAFLDLVPSRARWDEGHLAQLLGISKDEAVDLLRSFGYERAERSPGLWLAAQNPTQSALRRRIIEDYLRRTYEEPRND
jgi:hypothetical protein